MSLIRKNELKQLDKEKIENKINELNKELMKLNAQRYGGTLPENPGKIKQIKKTIAQLHTYSKNMKGGQIKTS